MLAASSNIALDGQDTKIVLEEEVGDIPVMIKREGGKLYAELTTAKEPEFKSSETDVVVKDYPINAVSCGLPFLFVPVKSLQEMQRVKVNPLIWKECLKNEWEQQIYLYTDETIDANCQFHARMFAADIDFGEDPATGSAAAAFAGYLGQLSTFAEGDIGLAIEQGLEMGRPSKLFVQAEKNNGVVSKIRVGGYSVLVSHGMMTI